MRESEVGAVTEDAHPIVKEFIREQLPMIVGVFALAIMAGFLQNGSLPGADRAFPVAGVCVPIWHLVWVGIWTGYTMGLVGEASGIFSLPYSMSILQFTGVAVSPTSLITTFLNPFGALLGYRREKQWNLDFALWLCVGALVGSPIGPFIRVYWFHDAEPFKMVIGCALLAMAIHLWIQITPWYLARTVRQRLFKEKFDRMKEEGRKAGRVPAGLPEDFRIITLRKSLKSVTISYWGEEQTFSVPLMFGIGLFVGVVASAMGVGGGFMLVPIMATIYGVPMYVLVAATIPFVIVLSITGLISYVITVPMLTGVSASPDWAFGLFIASGAILGAWVASKTQKFIPERYLKPMLGSITGLIGILYIVNYFCQLPFKV